MRQIKFRGCYAKGVENAGKWVYWGINGTDVIDCVDTDTIGQWTGLFDKEGKEIYEGDIIYGKLIKYSSLLTMGKIIYDEYWCSFANRNEAGDTLIRELSHIEVIGNIYENPELMGNVK